MLAIVRSVYPFSYLIASVRLVPQIYLLCDTSQHLGYQHGSPFTLPAYWTNILLSSYDGKVHNVHDILNVHFLTKSTILKNKLSE